MLTRLIVAAIFPVNIIQIFLGSGGSHSDNILFWLQPFYKHIHLQIIYTDSEDGKTANTEL